MPTDYRRTGCPYDMFCQPVNIRRAIIMVDSSWLTADGGEKPSGKMVSRSKPLRCFLFLLQERKEKTLESQNRPAPRGIRPPIGPAGRARLVA